ncbi:uncharacterized protein BDZ99DRAFT_119815 [Mytilinidion resinicola]|uniref:Uncharacterized protein n=1 Tax=Mytilinidion resinicola TaxID=574789 RepID=A0A6A6Z5U7_9PEZI|nr:uncharacterized protein BDZ99DRAFT_119815 [Mytilinidion resinicola]KAF2815637.1 hypothetical protein BDZ99DRAFT_119815 [Mytilinidion resinicola]
MQFTARTYTHTHGIFRKEREKTSYHNSNVLLPNAPNSIRSSGHLPQTGGRASLFAFFSSTEFCPPFFFLLYLPTGFVRLTSASGTARARIVFGNGGVTVVALVLVGWVRVVVVPVLAGPALASYSNLSVWKCWKSCQSSKSSSTWSAFSSLWFLWPLWTGSLESKMWCSPRFLSAFLPSGGMRRGVCVARKCFKLERKGSMSCFSRAAEVTVARVVGFWMDLPWRPRVIGSRAKSEAAGSGLESGMTGLVVALAMSAATTPEGAAEAAALELESGMTGLEVALALTATTTPRLRRARLNILAWELVEGRRPFGGVGEV